MKTNVRDTSIDAYRGLEWEGVTGQQERILLNQMYRSVKANWSLQELSRATGIAINAVSGRINGLKSRPPHHVVEADKRLCSVTGRRIIPVALRVLQKPLF